MTIQTTETPKHGQLRQSKGQEKMENRIIAVEVICGDIDTVFLYYTNNLVSGGANIMIEILRQGMLLRCP